MFDPETHLCLLCPESVKAGNDPRTWGMQWTGGWVHYSCADNLFDASRRVRGQFEIRDLLGILRRAEQTIRNLGMGFLGGEGRQIALKEADNIRRAL